MQGGSKQDRGASMDVGASIQDENGSTQDKGARSYADESMLDGCASICIYVGQRWKEEACMSVSVCRMEVEIQVSVYVGWMGKYIYGWKY